MGFGAFILFAVIVMGIAWFGTWVLGKVAPGHPAMVDTMIWVIAVVIVVIRLAVGIGVDDVAIPTIK